MEEVYVIVYTEKRRDAYEAAQHAKKVLESRGAEVEVYGAGELVGRRLPGKVDLIISLGGDGTILKSLGAIGGGETPILGVNFGRGGFLAEVEARMINDALERVLAKDYEVERILMLSIEADGRDLGDFLNEAYVSSRVMGKTLQFEIAQGGERLAEGLADALIISTPIGSTAYAFSAGGPIVDDELEAAVLAPVCPLSNLKPMVLSLKQELEIAASGDYGFSILLDGFLLRRIDERRIRLRVRRSRRLAHFVRLGLGRSFARRVRKKLG